MLPLALSVGDMARVRFLDHAIGDDAPCEFVALGRVHAVDPAAIVLDWWFYADAATPRDNNTERVCIVRAAILEAQRLAVI